MAIPTFATVIGSGFGEDAAQTKGYLDTNLRTIQDNFGRAAAAQQTQNNYLKDLAQMRQAQVDREAAAQQRTQDTQLGVDERQAAAADARRLNDQSFQFKMEQEKQKADKYKSDIAAENTTVDNAAKTLSSSAHQTLSAADEAQKAFDDATGKLDRAGSTIQNQTPGVRYDAKAKGFVALPPVYVQTDTAEQRATKVAAAQSSAETANAKLADARATYDQAKLEHTFHQKNAADFQNNAWSRFGLMTRHNGKTWELYNPKTDKAYAATMPPEPANPLSNFVPAMGQRAMADEASMETSPQVPQSGNWLSRFMNPWAAGGDSPAVAPVIPQAAITTRKRYNPTTGMVE